MKTEHQTIIGIDAGKSGAICVHKFGNTVIHKMPGNIPGITEVLTGHTKPIAFIEAVNHYPFENPQKKFGIQKMRDNYTQITTLLQMLGIPYVEVGANTWQRGLNIPKIKKEEYADRKTRLWGIAKNMLPNHKVYKYGADAVLITAFAIKKVQHDMDWVNEKLKTV